MADLFCSFHLKKEEQVVQHHGISILTFSVLDFIFSLVASCGNLLVIHALWKASTLPANMKMLSLSLCFSDLAVGLLAQPMRGAVMVAMLRMAANGNYNFDFLCPASLTACFFVIFLLSGASFLNITAIAVDRLLTISLHLRYYELVTSNRVITALLSLWATSAVAASIFISVPNNHNIVVVIVVLAGFLITTAVYIRIYRVLLYHHNQIQSQLRQPQSVQAREQLRENKSCLSALSVYVVFVTCHLPYFCTTVLLIANTSRISFWAAYHATFFFVFLNSSLNPFVYCWRYREIREIVKSTMKKILRFTVT